MSAPRPSEPSAMISPSAAPEGSIAAVSRQARASRCPRAGGCAARRAGRHPGAPATGAAPPPPSTRSTIRTASSRCGRIAFEPRRELFTYPLPWPPRRLDPLALHLLRLLDAERAQHGGGDVRRGDIPVAPRGGRADHAAARCPAPSRPWASSVSGSSRRRLHHHHQIARAGARAAAGQCRRARIAVGQRATSNEERAPQRQSPRWRNPTPGQIDTRPDPPDPLSRGKGLGVLGAAYARVRHRPAGPRNRRRKQAPAPHRRGHHERDAQPCPIPPLWPEALAVASTRKATLGNRLRVRARRNPRPLRQIDGELRPLVTPERRAGQPERQPGLRGENVESARRRQEQIGAAPRRQPRRGEAAAARAAAAIRAPHLPRMRHTLWSADERP